MKLQFQNIEVESRDGQDIRRKAQLAQCPNCGGQTFLVWQAVGHDHIHLQCFVCNESYCPAGKCGPDA